MSQETLEDAEPPIDDGRISASHLDLLEGPSSISNYTDDKGDGLDEETGRQKNLLLG